jgi:hypothetical protein
MDIANIIAIILGTVGTLTGCYAAWLSHKAAQQELTIVRTDAKLLRFDVVNFSLRPIPIQSISLELRDEDKFVPSDDTPSIEGISLPGVLAPESSFQVHWADTRQIVEVIVYEEFRLSIKTQIGKVFIVEGSTKNGANQSSEHTR